MTPNIKKQFLLALIIACVLTIFYFSWLPDSNFETETYLPLWLLQWCKIHFNLRTAIPFIALGFLFEIQQALFAKAEGYKTNFYSNFNTLIISTLIVSVAEVGQFFVTNRQPDFRDIAFGIMGTGIGIILFRLNNIKSIIRIKHDQ